MYNINTSVDLRFNQILDAIMHPSAGAPYPASADKLGAMYFDTLESLIKVCAMVNGEAVWKAVGVEGITYTFNGEKTDTEYVITITPSQGDPVVMRVPIDFLKLDGTSAMEGALNMNSHKVLGVTAGESDTDAVNKKQLDDAIKGIGNVFVIKGNVADLDELETKEKVVGHVYFVEADSSEYVCADKGEEGTPDLQWEKFGVSVDLSDCVKKSELAQTTGDSKTNAMSQDATTKAIAAATKGVVKKATATIEAGETGTSITVQGAIFNVLVKDATNALCLCDVIINGGSANVSIAKALDEDLFVEAYWFELAE